VRGNDGSPHLNAHAFRHSYVSALIFAGVDTVSISATVGHSKMSTTENIYGHVFAEAEERNVAVMLAKSWKKPVPKVSRFCADNYHFPALPPV